MIHQADQKRVNEKIELCTFKTKKNKYLYLKFEWVKKSNSENLSIWSVIPYDPLVCILIVLYNTIGYSKM